MPCFHHHTKDQTSKWTDDSFWTTNNDNEVPSDRIIVAENKLFTEKEPDAATMSAQETTIREIMQVGELRNDQANIKLTSESLNPTNTEFRQKYSMTDD